MANWNTRLDGWVNRWLGFGNGLDKVGQTEFSSTITVLGDSQVAAMFATESLSAKIVDVYPKEALREGFEPAGFDQDAETNTTEFLEPWDACAVTQVAAIWGRLFGGSAIWIGTARDPEIPLELGERVDFLRVIDRRFLQPVVGVGALDLRGNPIFYDLIPPEGGVAFGRVHASKMILFPGALTDDRMRIALGYRDLSVLQRPYDDLRSDGLVWESAKQLMSEASIGVTSIKGLFSAVAGKRKEDLHARLLASKRSESSWRTKVLDMDHEKYERVQTTFAGVADLTDRSIKRVAAAAEVPVTVLLGEAPAGLNATGDSDLRWFLFRVNAYRTHSLEPRVRRLLRVLLAQEGAPAKAKKAALDNKLTVKWPGLWTPSAKEQSEIYVNTANGDATYMDRQVVLPEEIGLSRFGEDGYSQETTIDRELREREPAAPLPEGATGPGGEDPNAPAPAKALGVGAPLGGPAPAGGEADIQKEAMNGAQVSSLIEVVKAVANEEIPREAGAQIIALAFQLTEAEAIKLLGPEDFEPTKEEPPPGFGGSSGGPPGAPGLKPPPTGGPPNPKGLADRRDEFDPDQPRDEQGQWSGAGAAGARQQKVAGRVQAARARAEGVRAERDRVAGEIAQASDTLDGLLQQHSEAAKLNAKDARDATLKAKEQARAFAKQARESTDPIERAVLEKLATEAASDAAYGPKAARALESAAKSADKLRATARDLIDQGKYDKITSRTSDQASGEYDSAASVIAGVDLRSNADYVSDRVAEDRAWYKVAESGSSSDLKRYEQVRDRLAARTSDTENRFNALLENRYADSPSKLDDFSLVDQADSLKKLDRKMARVRRVVRVQERELARVSRKR